MNNGLLNEGNNARFVQYQSRKSVRDKQSGPLAVAVVIFLCYLSRWPRNIAVRHFERLAAATSKTQHSSLSTEAKL